MVWNISIFFSSYWKCIIPTDEFIFFRGVGSTTNQWYYKSDIHYLIGIQSWGPSDGHFMVVVATGNVHILRISKNLRTCDYIEHSSAALNVMFVVKIPVFAGCTVFDCSLMLFVVVCNVSKIGPLISVMMQPLWSAVFFSQQALFSEKPELELMINQNLVDG